jgi:hypothetical protein
MFQACQLEIRDDFKVTQANCLHEPSRADRLACRTNAHENFFEGKSECFDQYEARNDACDLLGEYRFVDPLTDPNTVFVDPNDVGEGREYEQNPYVSVEAGRTLLLQGGEDFEERVVIHVTDQTREIRGIDCRIVWDVVLLREEDEDSGEISWNPVEVTQDWFAQSENGDVYYCGEAVMDFSEDGIVNAIDGSFEAGVGYARGGFLTKANPVPWDVHRQEMDLGNAEDIVKYLASDATPDEENEKFPCDPGCLKTLDFSPLDPAGSEHKFYLSGVGFVFALKFEDGEQVDEREELVCAGFGLEDTLEDSACELDNPDEILDSLCKLVPDALCDEEDD